MPRYTMQLTWPDRGRPFDYVFKADGKDAGRCYWHIFAGGQKRWHWTVYNSNAKGDELTLAEAQTRFKEAFEQSLKPKDGSGS